MSNKLKDSEKLAKENEEKYKRYKEAWDSMRAHWGIDSARTLFKAMAKLTNDPLMFKFAESQEVSTNNLSYDPYTVIKILDESMVGSLLRNNSMCYIVTNGKEPTFLLNDGNVESIAQKNAFVRTNPTATRLATPGEIQQCIAELNDAQWKTIMTDDLFASIVNEALNTPVKLGEGEINIEPDDSQG